MNYSMHIKEQNLHPVYEVFRHHYRRTVIGILKIDINMIKMLQYDWTMDL